MAEKRYKKLRTADELNKLMTRHYTEAKLLRRWRTIAWVTSGAPVEILRAMGIFAVYPENYTALCGARMAAVPLCEVAEAHGYSPDLCSYARTHLGMVLDSKNAPLGGLPRPDLLIAGNNICGTVTKWYEALSDYYKVPLFLLDTPFVGEGLTEHAVAYVKAQLEELILFLERHTRRRFRMNRLEEVLVLSDETIKLWSNIRQLCRARPSPLNAPDLFVNMAPIVVLRGTKQAAAFYRQLQAEVEERVAQGVGAIPEEKYRLLWDNIAIWYRLYRFYSLFVDYGACFVVDTYTGGWAMELATGDPLETLARTYASVFLNQSLSWRAERMIEAIKAFDVDGFVMHSNRSCKPYSLGQYAIRREVMARTGLPGLILEADMCDSRAYADAPLRTRIQAFMETLQTGGVT